MKISAIFEVTEASLYAVHLDGEDIDEFSLFFDKLTDVEYLHDFFTEHSKDLKNGFYKDQYGEITVEQAVEITLEEAEALEDKLLELSKQGQHGGDTLQTLFKPLTNEDYQQKQLQKNKVSGPNRKSWLRIYAIRISPNFFLVSGGAIKLTPTMNDREHLLKEITKLELAKNFLRENGVLEEGDHELFFEL